MMYSRIKIITRGEITKLSWPAVDMDIDHRRYNWVEIL